MGNTEVRKLETLSMTLEDMDSNEKTKKATELIISVNDLLDMFTMEGAYKGVYKDDKGPFFQVESYTRNDWQWWQIIASFARIRASLVHMKSIPTSEDDKKYEILKTEKRIAKFMAEMRGEL